MNCLECKRDCGKKKWCDDKCRMRYLRGMAPEQNPNKVDFMGAGVGRQGKSLEFHKNFSEKKLKSLKLEKKRGV